jgi:hypothetical protein
MGYPIVWREDVLCDFLYKDIVKLQKEQIFPMSGSTPWWWWWEQQTSTSALNCFPK